MWYGIAVAGLVVIVFFVFRKKRKKNKNRLCVSKHPSGIKVYGEKTQIKIRPALDVEKGSEDPKKVAVLNFKGDIRASSRFAFSKLVDEVILNADVFEKVVVLVESPGGGVSEYGLLFAELERLRALEEKFQLLVAVDTVAASGGYLMSIPAHQIIAAPFAMVGSIGVVSFIPNIRELLEANKIKPRTFTAGNFKRTVTLTDEGSPQDEEQYQQQLGLIHDQFKQALKKYRPDVDLEKVATGEAWLASTTLEKELSLVDKLQTSSSLLLELNGSFDVVELKWKSKKLSFLKKLLSRGGDHHEDSEDTFSGGSVEFFVDKIVDRVLQRFRV
jgi:serine protease SohB